MVHPRDIYSLVFRGCIELLSLICSLWCFVRKCGQTEITGMLRLRLRSFPTTTFRASCTASLVDFTVSPFCRCDLTAQFKRQCSTFKSVLHPFALSFETCIKSRLLDRNTGMRSPALRKDRGSCWISCWSITCHLRSFPLGKWFVKREVCGIDASIELQVGHHQFCC